MPGNVLLTLNSALGPGGLASLQAGLGMLKSLSGAMGKLIKDGQDYMAMLNNLNMDISKAEAATKGLVSSTEAARNALKLQAANVKINAEQYEALMKYGTKFAQTARLDVTETVNKLTESVIRGSARGLIPFGLVVKESTDKIKTQGEVLKMLTQASKDITIEYQTMTERLYALDNSFGTLIDKVVGGTSDFEFLNVAIEELTASSELLQRQIGDFGLKGTLVHGLNTANTGIGEMTLRMDEQANVISQSLIVAYKNLGVELLQNLGALDDNSAALLRNRIAADMVANVKKSEAERDAARVKLLADYTKQTEELYKRQQEAKAKAAGGTTQASLPNLTRGGKAKKEEKVELADMTPEQRLGEFAKEAEAQRKLAIVEQERAAFMEVYNAAFAGMMDEKSKFNESEIEQWEFERQRALEDEATAQRKAAYLKQFDEAEEVQWERERLMEEERAAAEDRKLVYLEQYKIAKMSTEERLMYEEEKNFKKRDTAERRFYTTKLQQAQTFFGIMSGLMTVENEKAFNIGKVAAIAEATVSTVLSAQKAYESMIGIPYVGVVLAPLAAAAATIVGIANVKKISEMKYGDTGAPSAATGSGVGVGSASASDYAQPAGAYGSDTTPQEKEIHVTLEIGGEQIHDAIIKAGETAAIQGKKTFRAA